MMLQNTEAKTLKKFVNTIGKEAKTQTELNSAQNSLKFGGRKIDVDYLLTTKLRGLLKADKF